jgi:hypothetical protein
MVFQIFKRISIGSFGNKVKVADDLSGVNMVASAMQLARERWIIYIPELNIPASEESLGLIDCVGAEGSRTSRVSIWPASVYEFDMATEVASWHRGKRGWQ